jgi:hypothetical protein
MTPQGRVRHALSGRTRIAVASKRNDLGYYLRVVQEIAKLPEVVEVTANPRSAGLLVIHEEGALPSIADRARERGWFELESLQPPDQTGIERAGAGLAAIDRVLKRSTRADVDVMSLVYLALMGMAVVQIARGQIMAPAVMLVWYAVELLNRNRPGNGQAGG